MTEDVWRHSEHLQVFQSMHGSPPQLPSCWMGWRCRGITVMIVRDYQAPSHHTRPATWLAAPAPRKVVHSMARWTTSISSLPHGLVRVINGEIQLAVYIISREAPPDAVHPLDQNLRELSCAKAPSMIRSRLSAFASH
jgi:hypothetical protein